VHLVGKDILRFHTVYWPAFLLAAGYGEEKLPTQVFVHGFLTIDGQKMSKSLRNAVEPVRLANDVGVEVLRYQLLRAIAFGQDGDFDHHAMLERYNADLGKNLGNLLSRVLGLCAKNTGGKTPAIGTLGDLENELFALVERESKSAAGHWEAIEPHRALEATWAISSAANQYVDRAAPWAEAKKGDQARIGTILATLLEVLRQLSVLIWPVLPKKSDELRAQLGLAPIATAIDRDAWPQTVAARAAGEALAPAGSLFPMLDDAAMKALLEKIQPKVEAEEKPEAKEPKKTEAPPPSRAITAPPPSAPETPMLVSYEQFAGLDLRVGVVTTAERVPKKDKLLKLEVDLGEARPRAIVAGLALTFKPEELVGKRVVVVANLAPREFGKGLVSFGMLLATGPSEALHLATIGDDVKPGARLK
jgi:methionyl-tRNA synthetase